MKKAKKTRRGPGFIPLLVMLVLIAIVGIELVKMGGTIKEKTLERDSVQADVNYKEQAIATLRSDLEKADDPEFILEKAQGIGYYPPNAKIFIDIHGAGD